MTEREWRKLLTRLYRHGTDLSRNVALHLHAWRCGLQSQCEDTGHYDYSWRAIVEAYPTVLWERKS